MAQRKLTCPVPTVSVAEVMEVNCNRTVGVSNGIPALFLNIRGLVRHRRGYLSLRPDLRPGDLFNRFVDFLVAHNSLHILARLCKWNGLHKLVDAL